MTPEAHSPPSGTRLTNPDEKLQAFKWRLGRKLHKPLGHHEAQASDAPPELELHAPDPETHAHGMKPVESSGTEVGRLCPACGSPAHAHDQKCPWCGAALSMA
jgi:hypothetical protein